MAYLAVSKTQEQPRRIWWHWQNLSQDDDRLDQKCFPWNGRAWLHLGLRRCVNVEWASAWRFHPAISFSAGSGDRDDGWRLHIGLWPVHLYLGFDGFGLPAPKEWSQYAADYHAKHGNHHCDGWIGVEKEFKVAFWNDGNPAIHWSIWSKTMEWKSSDPWWAKTHVIDLKDLLLGRPKHSKQELKTVPVKIPMEEGSHDGVAKLERCTWKRPRWPWPLVRLSWWLDIPNGIPHPGKGTTSYNCGEDGLYGIGAESRNGEDVEVVIAKAIESVMQDRRRYPL